MTDFDAAARSYLEGVAVASTKHGVVTDVTVSPIHMGLDPAAAPKIKTKTAPAQPLKALLHLDEATTAQPSVNLFDKAAAEYLVGKPPDTAVSPLRVVPTLARTRYQSRDRYRAFCPDSGRGQPNEDRQAAPEESPQASIALRRSAG